MPRKPAPHNRDCVAIEEIASALAHAIRNPLAGAMAQVELTRRRHAEGTADREACDRALACLEMIQFRVADLVEYANPPEPILRRVQVHSWLKQNNSQWRRQVEQAGRTFEWRFSGPNAEISCDPPHLFNCIFRLLENAIIASTDGATITMETRVVDGTVRLTVSNMGVLTTEGLSAAEHATSSKTSKGLGLGLALVRSAARAMGAKFELIQFEHETRATIVLVVARGAEEQS